MNSRICLLSTTLQATWRMGKEREVFSFQVSDKEKKNYSPSADFIASAVSTRDGFQKISRLKIQ